ncbi:hypothetical protein RND71_003171 [Anisodus tanguticus]|uniref:Uncharacterized protein n=1 Tax=Anisodus tanguticus TaxID=243964 RepID=A0AAE1SVF3_9SOLA|nr:hypothetical protein RND71_003171 [Anisodus tanguticus]
MRMNACMNVKFNTNHEMNIHKNIATIALLPLPNNPTLKTRMTMYLNKMLALEVESEDRLSNMPRNVIEYILHLMPIQDAARTSILVLGEAPVVSRIAPVVRNCLSHILLNIELTNLAQISYALLFIQCFFNLQMLQIWGLLETIALPTKVEIDDTCNSAQDVLNYLKATHNFSRALPNMEQGLESWLLDIVHCKRVMIDDDTTATELGSDGKLWMSVWTS